MDNLLLERSTKSYNSLRDYMKFIKQFPIVNNPTNRNILMGNLYACEEYYFSHDYPKDVIDYFDKMPLQLVFNTHVPNLYWGVNVHFLPILLRTQLLKRIMNLNPLAFRQDSKWQPRKINISYSIIKNIWRKAPTAVRCYRYDRTAMVHIIHPKDWINVSLYNPPTYFRVNIKQIVDRYKNFGI